HNLGHCTDCHTPLVEGQHDFSRIGAGGNVFPMPFGYEWSALAANITQHPELGIGSWTDDEIKRAITESISRDSRQLLPFMAFQFYKNITDEDLNAIVVYLRTLPPATAEPPAEHRLYDRVRHLITQKKVSATSAIQPPYSASSNRAVSACTSSTPRPKLPVPSA